MLVILAVGLKGRSRWVFGVVGVLTLVITASRGSQLGAIAGVIAIIVIGDNAFVRRIGRRWLLIGLGLVAALGLLAVLIRNPNLTGRTTYWTLAFDLWKQSPITGSGTSGLVASDLSIAGTNAHNLLFDAMVKTGLIGLLVVIAILVIAAVTTLKASLNRAALSVGLFTGYLVIGMAESDQGWLGMSLPWLWLVLAVTLAGRQLEET
ncbi:MAG: O-antigen ligase family protein, partial [Actinomycetota bacterium]